MQKASETARGRAEGMMITDLTSLHLHRPAADLLPIFELDSEIVARPTR